ncbi:LysR family transcriptional regulator [Roseospira marina]|uniref:LysR family transcriptional regulator n=1 Tax=Roseospira marina TaxID=140057 RepID=A0A5M6IDY3_9PROT|nr:TOBE domain-containing protein [Roseospira marina]KAA5605798.1 LysR family transcriptional regulator [Roseospira marina]MBB4313613.1 molybdate transport system regulatory protein [Roseospira marina]MBB5086775.1 molybdate transport system regulatory protein [Roseospira marina]
MTDAALHALLSLRKGSTGQIGANRIRLLEAVRDHGSISAAGRAVGLSYKAAWDGIAALNNLCDRPVVDTQSGGRHGGRAHVTPAGTAIIEAFHSVQSELDRVAFALERQLSRNDNVSLADILKGLTMRTSARNVLTGTVETIHTGAVNDEVILRLGESQTITAIVTHKSVLDLELTPGTQAMALIKSTFILLTPEDEIGRTSARNRLCGTVIAHEDGAVSTEIILDIGDGKTLAAIVTKDSADELGLAVGSRACALFKASHVIIAVP